MKTTAQANGWINSQRSNGISLADRLRSGYHRFWYEASQAMRWSWGPFRESSKGPLTNLTQTQQQRTDELARSYRSRFENSFPPETALLNYSYLDILDRAKHALGWRVPTNQRVCDLGSANFAYAAALHTFFHPNRLAGVEVDGHRLYCNGRSRIDYARGHIQDLPQTEYVIADYRRFTSQAEIITAWYPFVTPKPLLAWRLPLSLFHPAAVFAQVANNLVIGGTFIMVNHSAAEAEVARGIAEDVGLVCDGHYLHKAHLRPRIADPVLTIWHHG
ncbi:hypothetical protein PJI16_00735 [Nitrospira sp. MA-1]|nr:hypothetical protein [Nitrospira sp. MA-1]